MKKRNKLPIACSLGKLAERSIFKGKSRNPLRGWYRASVRSTVHTLKVDYTHR